MYRQKTLSDLKNLLYLLWRLGYVFSFQLPNPFVRKLGTTASFGFLRLVHRAALGESGIFTTQYATESLAASLGPSLSECRTYTAENETYGESLALRTTRAGEFFVQQTAMYRHGLLFDKWHKSAETIADLELLASDSKINVGTANNESCNVQQLKARIYLLWGQKDLLDNPIVLEGIEDLLPVKSQAVYLPRACHWTPIDGEAKYVIVKVLQWICGGENGELSDVVEKTYHGAVVVGK